MASKSAQDKIKKYSGVAKNVKDTTKSASSQQAPEEPRISLEQVIQAFQSFGFEPNERNNNDIGYWTTRPQSEGPKLMEELHKRRIAENEEEDETIKSKKTLPRLSDEDIGALFDEYGLPKPDPEWAREHLPNDPVKIRAILEMQRKTTDTMLKNEAKIATTPPPVAPAAPVPVAGAPLMGRGGPTPLDGQADMMEPMQPAKPFFVGDSALIKITNPQNPNNGTLWLVDTKRKVLRPILSEQGLENAFEDMDAAKNAIITVSAKELGPGGALEGFEPLQEGKGVKNDGSMDDIEYSKNQIQKRYGQKPNPQAENKALSMLDGVLGNMQTK
jgi:hypothetical protein